MRECQRKPPALLASPARSAPARPRVETTAPLLALCRRLAFVRCERQRWVRGVAGAACRGRWRRGLRRCSRQMRRHPADLLQREHRPHGLASGGGARRSAQAERHAEEVRGEHAGRRGPSDRSNPGTQACGTLLSRNASCSSFTSSEPSRQLMVSRRRSDSACHGAGSAFDVTDGTRKVGASCQGGEEAGAPARGRFGRRR